MKITVPEGPKSNLIHAICRFINFNDEGIIETGAVWTMHLGSLKRSILSTTERRLSQG